MAKTRSRTASSARARATPGPIPKPTDKKGRLSVIIEVRQSMGASPAFAMGMARSFANSAVAIDEEFEPVPLSPMVPVGGLTAVPAPTFGGEAYVVRGTVASAGEIERLKSDPNVAAVWADVPIAPFPGPAQLRAPQPQLAAAPMAVCPIPPCDCAPGAPKGTIADVATYLGVDKIWAAGFRGSGMVVGVVDGGITAQGRPVKPGETARRIPRVIGGWPTADWGTEAALWNEHGNMTSTDVLGMAPDAQIYDLRVSGGGGSPGTISRALQAFNWAISQHRLNGTPHILSNSWGIFQEAWDPTYARDPNHPFTRKVVEALAEGILVLFAAGNCGDTCPDGRCGADTGSGRSIWGANGHPLVMTVGAVNRNEEFIGYSSRGPAALDPNKPDFCSVSHFTGYFTSDSGTSAATPILAGAVALLKQAVPAATQDQIKNALRATAKDIGPAGFDHHSGTGIVRPHAAFQRLTLPPRRTLTPPCRPTFIGPGCGPRTLVPPCRPTTAPPCRPTVLPPCPRPTTTPPCIRPTLAPPCPRPTLGPPCPRPTLAGCPRPTLMCGRPPGPGGEPQPEFAEGWYSDPWAAYYAQYGYDPWAFADPYQSWGEQEAYPEDWSQYPDPEYDPGGEGGHG